MAAEASFVVEGADPASAIPFDLYPGSKVKVASLLEEFDAGRIKYEKRPGVYVVMEEGPDGLSLAQFTPSSSVNIRITPSQGAAPGTGAAPSPADRFSSLLLQAGIQAQEQVLTHMSKFMAGRVMAALTPAAAAQAYKEARALPWTATRQRIRTEQGVLIDGPYPTISTTRSTLLWAIQHTKLRVLKIPESYAMAEAEVAVWDRAKRYDGASCLVGPMELLSFSRGSLDIQQTTLQRSAGILMPAYMLTLAQVPASVDQELIARVGQRMTVAMSAIHAAGLVHCDIKNTNILLDTNMDSYLGDYGAVVRMNEEVTETSEENVPMDRRDELLAHATPLLDHTMLMATLLHAADLLSTPFTMAEMQSAMGRVTCKDLTVCLQNLSSVG